MANWIDEWIKKKESKIQTWRRHLHQRAEVGFCEYETTHYIVEQLQGLGFTLYTGEHVMDKEARFGVPSEQTLATHEERALTNGVPKEFLEEIKGGFTGVIAVLDTGRQGKHAAMRFDIDALPIEEAEEETHLPAKLGFRSTHAGMMHACGHDGHTAIGMATAHFISEHCKQLNGRFTLIFQPAEEGSRGANAIVQKGWLDNVDVFWSGHLGIKSLPVGTLVSGATDILATTKIDVELCGQTAHAGMSPHEGKNTLVAASSLVLGLHAIAPHGDGTTRINVGYMESGSGRNIIPGHAFLQLETRGSSTRENQYMKQEAFRRIEGAAQMHGVSAQIDIVGEGLAANTDHMWLTAIPEAVKESDYVSAVQDNLSLGGSEDVTYMMQHVQEAGGKAAYMIYGTPLVAGHHHRLFDFDEAALPVAVSALAHLVDTL